MCICERVFSKGKLILTDLRGSMDPFNFEDLLILSYYDDLWDVYLVNEVVEEERKRREIEKQSRQIFPREEEPAPVWSLTAMQMGANFPN